jgi:hypothetical protein
MTAEADLLGRRIVTIPAKDWKKFEAWANHPAKEIKGLQELASKVPTWQAPPCALAEATIKIDSIAVANR